MKKIISLIHMSLDGYVAKPDEDIFNEVTALTARADTALYGRKTYNNGVVALHYQC